MQDSQRFQKTPGKRTLFLEVRKIRRIESRVMMIFRFCARYTMDRRRRYSFSFRTVISVTPERKNLQMQCRLQLFQVARENSGRRSTVKKENRFGRAMPSAGFEQRAEREKIRLNRTGLGAPSSVEAQQQGEETVLLFIERMAKVARSAEGDPAKMCNKCIQTYVYFSFSSTSISPAPFRISQWDLPPFR